MTGRVAPGWYPDYEAPPGHQRYWDGQQWTERRPAAPTRWPMRRVAVWVAAGVAAAVLVLVLVLVTILLLTDDEPSPSGSSPSGSSLPPASTPGTPAATTEPEAGATQVASVLDDGTIELGDGSQVVLVGVTVGDCGVSALGELVNGRQVTLAQPGADTDSLGRLLRYVDRDGLDVGLRLLQRGLATASDEANPRRAIYQRVDARSPDVC